MIIVQSHSANPYYNLAAEEYFLKNFRESVYFQYVNRPTVVVGKHQNALAEVDLNYLESNAILLARRISGGGAVYHDSGNINFSFITTEEHGNYVRMPYYAGLIVEALRPLGADLSLGKRNELLLGDKKVSGTASHVWKSRVIHHGTLLYDADLQALSKCLYVDSSRIKDKAVKSVRSEVVNLHTHLKEVESGEDFSKKLLQVMAQNTHASFYELSEKDDASIEELLEKKFKTWDWNYGYSPLFEVLGVYCGEPFSVQVEKGRIVKLEGSEQWEVCRRQSLVGEVFERRNLARLGVEEELLRVLFSA